MRAWLQMSRRLPLQWYIYRSKLPRLRRRLRNLLPMGPVPGPLDICLLLAAFELRWRTTTPRGAAYALIYEKGEYEAAITALRALDHDNNADVANLIGYASRKLGRYDDAKVWYERSLAADPNHAVTWSYYGMWQAEQGNLLKAKDDLEKVRLICGTTCEPYKMLKDVIDGTATY